MSRQTAVRETDTGVEGNSRLTAVNGTTLLVLLAVEGVTVLDVRGMITLHVYLGVLLIGPVVLKIASTAYRFARYYGGARPYLLKGPPHPILRVLGPVVILSTLAVLGTGVALVATGPDRIGPWLTLHQASFVVWFAAMSIHVLGHINHGVRTTWQEIRDPRLQPAVRRRRARTLLVALGLIAGVALASFVLPAAHSWTRDAHEVSDGGGDN